MHLNAIGIKKIESRSLFLLLLSIPTQLGKHFWLESSLVLGRQIDYLSPTLYLTDIFWLVWVLAIIFLNKKIIFKKLFFYKYKIFIGIIIGLILIFISKNQLITFFYLLRIFELSIFSILLIFKKPHYNQFIYPLIIGVFFAVFLEINQILSQSSIGGWWYFLGERRFDLNTPGIAHSIINGNIFIRPYAFFSHPNVLGGYLLTLSPLCFFWQINENSKPQYILKKITQALLIIGIFLTFSRMVWFGAGLTAVFIFRKKFGILKLLLPIATLFILEEIFVGRFVSLYQDTQSVVERNQLIANVFDIFRNSPIFGVGLGNFIPQLATIQRPPYLFQPAHNFWLMILVETGISGLILAIIFFIKNIKKCLTDKKFYLFISLMIFFWLSWFDHYFYDIKQTQWLLALIMSLVWL